MLVATQPYQNERMHNKFTALGNDQNTYNTQ